MVSEMLVDWLKHAFITKFNHIRPSVYERYIDVLCRDLASGSAFGRRGARKVPLRFYQLEQVENVLLFTAYIRRPVSARRAQTGLCLTPTSSDRHPDRVPIRHLDVVCALRFVARLDFLCCPG